MAKEDLLSLLQKSFGKGVFISGFHVFMLRSKAWKGKTQHSPMGG